MLFRERGRRGVLLAVEGAGGETPWSGTQDYQQQQKRIDATVFVDLPANGSRQFVVKLPSPIVPDARGRDADGHRLCARRARRRWSSGRSYSRAARSSACRSRPSTTSSAPTCGTRSGCRVVMAAAEPDVAIDLPYSNFAYSQTGTPWPVNQAVYVDYMLYDLRGYHAISAEELEAQFRNNQEPTATSSGYANWLVYTPAMLYAVAQNYLLSHDRAAFERLLPQSLQRDGLVPRADRRAPRAARGRRAASCAGRSTT